MLAGARCLSAGFGPKQEWSWRGLTGACFAVVLVAKRDVGQARKGRDFDGR